MLSKDNLLELQTRRNIYDIIVKNPGLHLRELSRRIDISYGNFIHHLNFLLKQEYVITKSDSRYKRYYVSNKIGKQEKEFLNIVRQDIPRKIVLLLLSFGPHDHYIGFKPHEKHDPSKLTRWHSLKELGKLTKYWDSPYNEIFNLKKHRTTIDFHLNKLLDADIIDKKQDGKELKFKIKDDMNTIFLLIKYQKTLADPLVDQWLTWINRCMGYGTNKASDVIYDIFPHPYHA